MRFRCSVGEGYFDYDRVVTGSNPVMRDTAYSSVGRALCPSPLLLTEIKGQHQNWCCPFFVDSWREMRYNKEANLNSSKWFHTDFLKERIDDNFPYDFGINVRTSDNP